MPLLSLLAALLLFTGTAVVQAERKVTVTVGRSSDAASRPAAGDGGQNLERGGRRSRDRVIGPGGVLAERASKRPPRGSAYAGPNNIYGAHLLVDDGLPGTKGHRHLQWARHLVGRWGYAKTLFGGIDANTKGAAPGWVDYVKRCYEFELIPVIRLAGHWTGNGWIAPQPDKPGDYSSMAEAVHRVVSDLPRSDLCPLYIEVWNEPNLPLEWSGKPNPQEYADFFVQVAEAIRDIGDDRIYILNGALSTDLSWVEKLCDANERFIDAFDVWSSHPYPHNRPPSINHHDKTAPPDAAHTIDSYLLETAILARRGRPGVPVMITETGYDLGNSAYAHEGHPIINEANRADYTVRAFRDHWSKWPEIIAVTPFEFSNEAWERFDWVYPASPTTEDGIPTQVHAQYAAVAALAKPTDRTGAVNGNVTVGKLGSPLEDVRVVVRHQLTGSASDLLGNYFLPDLRPGKYDIIADKPGFEEIEREVTVARGANTVLDLQLRPLETETLTGTVLSGDDGEPLEDVVLTLEPGGYEVKTDKRGRYEFEECVPTRYTLRATDRGRLTYDTPLQIELHKPNEHDFVLGDDKTRGRDNMMQNAGFEAGGGGAGKPEIALGYEPWPTASYRAGMCNLSERHAHTGRWSKEIEMRPDTLIRQITHYNTARPGTTYVAGAWVRTDTSDDDAAAWIGLTATRNDGSDVASASVPRGDRVTGRSERWQWLEVRLTAPEGAERLSVEMHAAGSRGSAYFDDLFLSPTKGR